MEIISLLLLLILVLLVIIGLDHILKSRRAKNNPVRNFIEIVDHKNKRRIHLDVTKILYFYPTKEDPVYSIVKLVGGEEILVTGGVEYLKMMMKNA